MIQEIVRLEDSDDYIFELKKTPLPKTKDTSSLGKVKVIGHKDSRGPGDDCYYIIQFDDDSIMRIYNAKKVLFGKPKPEIKVAKPSEILQVTA